MKFEADDPSEVTRAGSECVDRSQGAARAISVRGTLIYSFSDTYIHSPSLIQAWSGQTLIGSRA